MQTEPHTGTDPAAALLKEYSRRKRTNPRYSQRAFARFLGLPSGRLCEILQRRRRLTPVLGARIAEKLAYGPTERARFLEAIQASRVERARARRLFRLAEDPSDPVRYRELANDVFQAISSWHHYALLSLVRTKGFRNDCRWIGKRLGIPAVDARAALDRLLRLGLLREDDGVLRRVEAPLTTSHDIPSAAVRRWHHDVLGLAQGALETVPVDRRDLTTVTMAIDPKRLPLAKKMIRNFRRGLSEILEDGSLTEVYTLAVSLFPMSREET